MAVPSDRAVELLQPLPLRWRKSSSENAGGLREALQVEPRGSAEGAQKLAM